MNGAGFWPAREPRELVAVLPKENLGQEAPLERLILPALGVQLAFDVDVIVSGEMRLGERGEALVDDHHAMPFPALLRSPLLASCQCRVVTTDSPTILRPPSISRISRLVCE